MQTSNPSVGVYPKVSLLGWGSAFCSALEEEQGTPMLAFRTHLSPQKGGWPAHNRLWSPDRSNLLRGGGRDLSNQPFLLLGPERESPCKRLGDRGCCPSPVYGLSLLGHSTTLEMTPS